MKKIWSSYFHAFQRDLASSNFQFTWNGQIDRSHWFLMFRGNESCKPHRKRHCMAECSLNRKKLWNQNGNWGRKLIVFPLENDIIAVKKQIVTMEGVKRRSFSNKTQRIAVKINMFESEHHSDIRFCLRMSWNVAQNTSILQKFDPQTLPNGNVRNLRHHKVTISQKVHP
jgi:hypothetical protein